MNTYGWPADYPRLSQMPERQLERGQTYRFDTQKQVDDFVAFYRQFKGKAVGDEPKVGAFCTYPKDIMKVVIDCSRPDLRVIKVSERDPRL